MLTAAQYTIKRRRRVESQLEARAKGHMRRRIMADCRSTRRNPRLRSRRTDRRALRRARQPEPAADRGPRAGRPAHHHHRGRELSRLRARHPGPRDDGGVPAPGRALRHALHERRGDRGRLRQAAVRAGRRRQGDQGRGADHRDRRVGEVARNRVRKAPDGLRRERVRDLRRRLLQGQGCDRGRRRRHRDGRGDVPDPLLQQGDRRASARHAARLEDHAGSRAQESEDRVHLEFRDRGNPRRAERRRQRRAGCKNLKTGAVTDHQAPTASSSRSAISRTPRSSRASSRWTSSAT